MIAFIYGVYDLNFASICTIAEIANIFGNIRKQMTIVEIFLYTQDSFGKMC